MRMTEADAIAHATRHGLPLDAALTVPPRPGWPQTTPSAELIDRAPPSRRISKTEQRYAQVLDVAQHEGRIKAWWPCPIRCWIAPGMSYTADYLTQASGPDVLTFLPSQPVTLSPAFAASLCRFGAYGLTLIEVKHTLMYGDHRALDRLQVAASLYPMLCFRLARWDAKRQTFHEKEVPAL